MDKVNKYNNSFIYILKPKIINENEKPLIYYGFTLSNDLKKKLLIHIEDYKNNITYNITDNYKTSYKLIEKYGDKGIDIELVKIHNCKNQYELDKIYKEYIINNDCVNNEVEFISKIEYIKNYCETNKEKVKETKKKYREENKDEISLRQYFYRKENKEKIKDNYEKNKDKINEKKREKFNCECGSSYTYNHKSEHMKTKKHLNYINNLNINN